MPYVAYLKMFVLRGGRASARGPSGPVARDSPPLVTLSLLTPHRRLRDPKIRLFSDFIAQHCRAELAALTEAA